MYKNTKHSCEWYFWKVQEQTSLHTQVFLTWTKNVLHKKSRECLKNTSTFLVVINPQSYESVNACDDNEYQDPMYSNLNKEVPFKQKDSALSVCSLNIRSLTIKEDSVKLKRLFKLEASIIVLTEVCVDGSDFDKLHQYWREQVSKYQIWTTGSKYCGIMILIVVVIMKIWFLLTMTQSFLTLFSQVELLSILPVSMVQVTKMTRTSGTCLSAIMI